MIFLGAGTGRPSSSSFSNKSSLSGQIFASGSSLGSVASEIDPSPDSSSDLVLLVLWLLLLLISHDLQLSSVSASLLLAVILVAPLSSVQLAANSSAVSIWESRRCVWGGASSPKKDDLASFIANFTSDFFGVDVFISRQFRRKSSSSLLASGLFFRCITTSVFTVFGDVMSSSNLKLISLKASPVANSMITLRHWILFLSLLFSSPPQHSGKPHKSEIIL